MSFHEKFGFWADVIVETSYNNLLIMVLINGSDFNDNNTINGTLSIFRPALNGTDDSDTLNGGAGSNILNGPSFVTLGEANRWKPFGSLIFRFFLQNFSYC